jgi:hypothetical protein
MESPESTAPRPSIFIGAADETTDRQENDTVQPGQFHSRPFASECEEICSWGVKKRILLIAKDVRDG